jgi:hypothetical protein
VRQLQAAPEEIPVGLRREDSVCFEPNMTMLSCISVLVDDADDARKRCDLSRMATCHAEGWKTDAELPDREFRSSKKKRNQGGEGGTRQPLVNDERKETGGWVVRFESKQHPPSVRPPCVEVTLLMGT